MSERIDLGQPERGGASRRGVLKCLAWAGTGLVWSVSGGVPRSLALGGTALAAPADSFTFVQISDTHIGFNKEANPDPAATLQQALDRIAAMPQRPAMLVHTGDLTHLTKPAEFDTAAQILKGAKHDIHYVPGEHDVIGDNGKEFFERFAPQAKAGGWYSFDQGGVHFVALVNVVDLKAGGLGNLGTAQLEWLAADLKDRTASTPIVVLAHMPLWAVYPQWGWGTDDSEQALGHLKRFGSVTVLNGHIHQVLQKVEGTVSLRTALSTAFPQPAPGAAPSPGPMKVAADRLRSVLGIRRIDFAPASGAVVQDQTLA
jgi:Icc protein